MLELREVCRHYPGPDGETIRAVDGVSLTLVPGELIAVYGPSGSGKSTLLMLAAGIARPDSGTVLFEGRNLGRLSRREATHHRRRQLGFVMQSANLVPGLTAIDNAGLKLMVDGTSRKQARRDVISLLDRLGLAGRAEHRVTHLSHGERQRVAIARALSNGPRMLLADEPTANLDTRRAQEVTELLVDVCREQRIGVLLVTHDPRVAEHVDRVLELRDGRLRPLDVSSTQDRSSATSDG